MATVADIRTVALAVGNAAKAGDEACTQNGVRFSLIESGMCMKDTRQIHEAALGIPAFAWRWARHYAIEADFAMRAAGLQATDPETADVVCFDHDKLEGATPGHIAVYCGGGVVVENTSCGTRGNPQRAGTKITRIDEIDPTGVRRMFFRTVELEHPTPNPYADGPLTVLGPDGAAIPCHAYLSNGVTGCNDAKTLSLLMNLGVGWPASYPAQMMAGAMPDPIDCTAYVSAPGKIGVNNLRALLAAYGLGLHDDIATNRTVIAVKLT